VSKAIRRTIHQIEKADRLLGRELDRTIETGFYCCYVPDPVRPRDWKVPF
jgi:hypothetical protein